MFQLHCSGLGILNENLSFEIGFFGFYWCILLLNCYPFRVAESRLIYKWKAIATPFTNLNCSNRSELVSCSEWQWQWQFHHPPTNSRKSIPARQVAFTAQHPIEEEHSPYRTIFICEPQTDFNVSCKPSVNGKDINFNFHAISKQFSVTRTLSNWSSGDIQKEQDSKLYSYRSWNL